MGSNRGLYFCGTVLERADLFLSLAFMCATLLVSRRAVARILDGKNAAPFAMACAALLVCGVIVPRILAPLQPADILMEGLLVGVSLAGLFLTWGRALGMHSPRTIACEVFVATGFASAICFACAALPSTLAFAVPILCAVSSSLIAIRCLDEPPVPPRPSSDAAGGRADTLAVASSPSIEKNTVIGPLSRRMVAGAATFGVAAGFMETYRSDPGMLSTPDFPATLLILALFCIAVLQSLFVEKPAEGESLGSMYRIAMLVIMSGFLFAPLLQGSGVPGEAIIMAGYLGLAAAFMAFFLVTARVSNSNAVDVFGGGLAALYLGEVAGIAAANVYDVFALDDSFSYGMMAFAGLAILVAYLFLFTEKDFRALSAIVGASDSLEKVCDTIASQFGLSSRETEVLLLALKGRSNERIAQELFIAKSTADTHMRRIYAKCGIKGRQDLIDLGERIARESSGKRF